MEPLRGVYHILSTPFHPDGSLDEAGVRRLVNAVIDMGVDGITILGVAGEAQKLLDDERKRVIGTVMDANAGRVPIIVGASQNGTDTTIAACREAEAAGAAGVMIAPPTFQQAGPTLTAHYQQVADAIDIPIVLQDFPPVNGVTLSPQAMADLVAAVPAITTIKLEGIPSPQRTGQTLALSGDRITIVGGLGGMYLLDELRRGSSGTMTGFAYPEVLIQIWRAWANADRQRATEIYYRYMPLLVFEGQPGLGVAIRKEILRRRGLIESALVRHPGPRLDDGILADLGETIDFLEIDQAFASARA